jgi:hypothetical protein
MDTKQVDLISFFLLIKWKLIHKKINYAPSIIVPLTDPLLAMDTTSIFATKLIKEWEVIPISEFLMESSKKKEKSLPKKIS